MGKSNSQAGIPPKPACLSVLPDDIPDDLKHFPQWVCWRLVWDKKKNKWTKPPYQTNGSLADKTNPQHWSDFDEALAAYQDEESGFDGIGFCTTKNDPFFFADLDDCFVDDAVQKRADYIVGRLDSYTETSPSDKGLRIICKGKLPANRRTKGIELYSSGAYLTITGQIYFQKGIESRQNEIDQLYKELFPDTQQTERPESDHTEWTQEDKDLCARIAGSKQGEKFQRLFSGNIDGYPSESEADLALCCVLSFWTGKDAKQIDRIFRQSKLYRPKWDNKHGDQTYGAMTIGKAIEKCTETVGSKKTTVEPAAAGDDVDDITIKEWPVLDDKAFHGFAGRFVRFATENSEADPAAVLVTLLVRLGVEIPHVSLWVGDAKHRPNICSVIVGSSSKSRKGTSGKPISRLFEPLVLNGEYLFADRARTSPGPFSSGEGIIYAVRDAVMGIDKKTGEPIQVDPGVDDKRLFILDEEFGGVLSNTKREGNTLSANVRMIWDSGNLDPLTKTTKIKATGAHIGWVSHITLFELISRLSETESLNGFGNRILWVCARRSKLVAWPEPMDAERLQQFQYELSEIIASHKDADNIIPDGEVRRAWQDCYYEQLTQERPGQAGCLVNRAEAQVMRLALIYALLDKSQTIRIEHLEAAHVLWQYCEDSAMYIFDGRQTDSVGQKIVDALQDGPLTGTDLFKLFSNNISRDRLKMALTELEAAGKIGVEQEQTGGRGRPRSTYFLKVSNERNELNEEKATDSPGEPISSLNSFNSSGEKKKHHSGNTVVTGGKNGLHYGGVI